MLALILAFVALQGYSRPDLLVSTAWVAAHAADPDVRVVDMRRSGYEAGRIPGAVRLDNDAIRVPSRPPYFLPTEAEFDALMVRLGISSRTRVVVYDDRGGIYAARLWFVLNAFGHANVALLDGGWTKWTKEGRPASTEPPPARTAVFRSRLDLRWVATASDVVAAIDRPGVHLVDARTAGEIEGRDLRGIRRGGAVPGAVAVYWEDALDPEWRTFRSAAEIRALYRDRGIGPDDEVVAYCQIGMRASHDVFTLALIGHTKLRVYYGSWEEWGNRDDLPVGRIRR